MSNFVMIRWSRNQQHKRLHFLSSPKYKCSILTHWTCDWYTYNFSCQHMVCDKPHSPVLHPCESDSINFRETQLKFFYADAWLPLFKPWVDMQSSGSLVFSLLHPSLDSVFIASSNYYIIQNIFENLNWSIYLRRLVK